MPLHVQLQLPCQPHARSTHVLYSSTRLAALVYLVYNDPAMLEWPTNNRLAMHSGRKSSKKSLEERLREVARAVSAELRTTSAKPLAYESLLRDAVRTAERSTGERSGCEEHFLTPAARRQLLKLRDSEWPGWYSGYLAGEDSQTRRAWTFNNIRLSWKTQTLVLVHAQRRTVYTRREELCRPYKRTFRACNVRPEPRQQITLPVNA